MVARFIEGWEHSTVAADYAGRWPTLSLSTGSIGAANGRYGNGVRLAGSGSPNFQRVLDAQATWVVGFAYRYGSLNPSVLCQFQDSAVNHCGLAVDASGILFAYRSTTATVLGTSAATLTPGVWVYLEVKATIHDTAGVFVVRVNGTPVLTLTSVDTRNAGNPTANTVRFQSGGTGGPTGDFDDIYLFDATGSVNNDFVGDVRVERLAPSGAGATTAWTPSAGANYAAVDETPPNADTDYVSSSTAGQTDTYAYGNLTTASGTVYAVQATALARKDDAGSRSMALVARPGSTDRLGATQGLGDAYSTYTEVWNTNPDTAAAWTLAEVNASEWGQRLIA